MTKRKRARAGAALAALGLLAVAAGARAQQSSVTLKATVTYSDQYSQQCEEQNANNPYAGMNPLTCHGESGPTDSLGHCSYPKMTLWKQVGNTCYYCSPINPPITGIVIPIDQTGDAEQRGFKCGLDQADACMAICSGTGPYTPPPLLEGQASQPEPTPETNPNPGPGATQPVPGPTQYSVPVPGPPPIAGAANPCEPFGSGGYNYCANAPGTRLPAGCICSKAAPGPPLAGTSQTSPQSGTPTPPSNPVVDTGLYVQGLLRGMNGCIEGFGLSTIGAIAAVGAMLQGNSAVASQLLGVPQAVVTQVMGEMTKPVIGSNSNPYDSGYAAGQRLCAYIAIPAAGSAVGAGLKGILSGTAAGAAGAAAEGGAGAGAAEGSAGEGAAGGASSGAAQGRAPPGETDTTIPGPGTSQGNPLQGSVLQSGVDAKSATGLANTWIKLANGQVVQLGDAVGSGSFADVFKFGQNQVIKLAKSAAQTDKYGPESLQGQVDGAELLQKAGVKTPDFTELLAATDDAPASVLSTDVNTMGDTFQLSTAGYQGMTAANRSAVDVMLQTMDKGIGDAGIVWADPNPANISPLNTPEGLVPIVHDPDMVMTVNEIMSPNADPVRMSVLKTALTLGGAPANILEQPFTSQSLMSVIHQARMNWLNQSLSPPPQ